LLERRHKIQKLVAQACIREPLLDEVVEAHEMYQNADEKGVLHSDPQTHHVAAPIRLRAMVRGRLTVLPLWGSSAVKVARFN
jgi:hypothetical protein